LNRSGGTARTRNNAAHPQCGHRGNVRSFVATGAATSIPGGAAPSNARARSSRQCRPRLASNP